MCAIVSKHVLTLAMVYDRLTFLAKFIRLQLIEIHVMLCGNIRYYNVTKILRENVDFIQFTVSDYTIKFSEKFR